jgi:hypothetical protein
MAQKPSRKNPFKKHNSAACKTKGARGKNGSGEILLWGITGNLPGYNPYSVGKGT